MVHSHRKCLSAALLAGAILALLSPTVFAAPPKPVKVNFETVDGVNLKGLYYANERKTDGACVLMLSAVGNDMKKTKGWDNLALSLQAKGCAVLMFDYRGHGDSGGVQDEVFWTYPIMPRTPNKDMVKGWNGTKGRDTISWKDFRQAGYFPCLVNDIAAAKAFLDRKNDSGELNSANMIVIGEGNGCALGALWLKSEWYRRRVTGNRAVVGPLQLDKTPEGKDVICAIWLSFNTEVGPPKRRGVTFNWESLLTFPDNKEKSIAMAFVYGDKDKAKTVSERAKGWLNKVGKKEKPNKLIGTKKIADSGNAAGRELLQKDLETEGWIANYVEKVLDAKGGNSYDTKDFRKSTYVWVIPGYSRALKAKDRDEKCLLPIPWGQLK
jgi:hypothetical protein